MRGNRGDIVVAGRDSMLLENLARSGTCDVHGDIAAADQNFTHACQANSRAANSWFLRGYIAWKRGDSRQAAAMLTAARNARGPDWKPSGSVLEGDVQHRMFSEAGFLTLFERQWDGTSDLVRAYAPLDAYLHHYR